METSNPLNILYASKNFQFAHTAEPAPHQEDYYRHNHPQYELYVFFEGNAKFVVEDRVFHLTPDTVLLIPSRTYHYAALQDSARPYDRLVLNFERSFVFPELHPLLDSGNNPYFWDSKKYTPLLKDAERCLSQYKSRDGALLVQLFLNRLLLEMKYSPQSISAPQMLNPAITQILSCINEHIHEPLSLKTISEYTFLNQSYLSQIFSSYMKIGLMDYVKQKKIYLAEDMIRDEGVTPTEASRRLGFADYSTFYRLFKKYLKINPSDK